MQTAAAERVPARPVSTSRVRGALRSVRNAIARTRVSPMLLPYVITSARDLIDSDVTRWVELEEIGTTTPLTGLLHLLAFFPHYRTLYYYRLSRSDTLTAVVAALVEIVYRQPTWIALRPRQLGRGFYIQHGVGANINGERIGDNCQVNQQATIGFRNDDGLPILGNNVLVAAGARILGGVVIGDDAIIGANAVVVKDVPAGCTVAGVPARIIRRNGVRCDQPL